ncbi:bifunctional alpha,alpha-trehalose-phosphate synthase (UDP-forming)/trehalose-phosphatase [Leptospira kanakyensis]|uniref:Bifunctional alpha,alpha-trehalose-phosphate synthase (UDP-forming)/trehalose-phosphatase n=1 Tax=Leptospira kanakyensis TaxID=2484968 RepID=A0A6N4Q9S6_9LEPT|nr:bifunctional alpha,alpha-trehalose-phosphate synthase (UDP-forming)/trehalose-phosphatase [Leptospira kanakyensis]TGK55375.1 bifunctional alpha,alpha-trehalose-phosphate synthase (UDP-forming)/trehalose-phosphatase [Leptospira kanakyensis]TGK60909.1 bifunctional alpha,alpha-trehalose-phosphate synthase (UDP-forming)/trehalose-phosphatase [Leptospira kanakyensis]TGK76616.1 bifunctional alpha,alpha-trehalose-phosphate synthase (UDP-forming)/trehalose-phosphatase [Leptospira kanakyensis]
MRLILVSNRLPVQWDGTPNVGGLATGLSSFLSHWKSEGNEIIWVGWPGKSIPEKEQPTYAEAMKKEHGTVPVFLKQKLADSFYNGFCNKTIWPLFHYFTAHCEYLDATFDAFEEANNEFAKAVTKVYQPGDWVWVHDYHLFLLPGILRNLYPNIILSFFLHIPFPTFEIFRLLPEMFRTKILTGVLGSDLIGFHTQSYTQYFLRTLLRCLGIENERGFIYHQNHITKTGAFPMGINVEQFTVYAKSKECRDIASTFNKNHKDLKQILSVDRLDYTKGVLQRLNAFELFLKQNPLWIKKCKLVLVLVPSRTDVSSYQSMKRAIDEKVGSINGSFGTLDWTPILYQYKGFPFEELVPLYRNTQVMLVTPFRDGMNLVAKEFLVSQTNGMLVLSEMAGASAELPEAILVNPNDLSGMADSIKEAIEMDEKEIHFRNQVMINRLSENTVNDWAKRIFSDTEDTSKKNLAFQTKSVSPNSEFLLPTKDKPIFLIFDYDGTLVPFEPLPHLAVPSQELLNSFMEMLKISNLSIAIISGRDKSFLEKTFKTLPVHLVAEHGAWHKPPYGSKWNSLFTSNADWKSQIKDHLNEFTKRVPGSFTEEKEFSLVWHFRNADPDIGLNAAREMLDELSQISSNSGFFVQRGNKIIEVREYGTGKGKAASKIVPQSNLNLFVFGDDTTDEDMFRELPESAFTIKIGKSETMAKYRFKNPEDVHSWIQNLISHFKKEQ